MMKSSLEELFRRMEIYYENILNLNLAMQEATKSNNNDITVELKNIDGSIELVTINSFQKILQDITRIDANYRSLISSDNISYTVEADGSVSQQTKTTFMNAEFISDIMFDESNPCFVDINDTVSNLIFPTVKIPVTINTKLKSEIKALFFEIEEGWENIAENPSILSLEYLRSQGVIQYFEYEKTLKIEKQQIEYFGKFSIENISTSGNLFIIQLNDIKYQSLYTNGNTIDLQLNDILVSNTGASKYRIVEIDKFRKIISVEKVAGIEIPSIGIDKLYFNTILPSTDNIVGIPVKPATKIVVFLSTENFSNISYPSLGLKFDTTEYTVDYNNTTYTIDEFFGKYVTNFTEYLYSLVNNVNIPVNLGIQPDKPELLSSNFKVVQVNKHLSETNSVEQIETLNKQKNSISNDIEFYQQQISKLQTQINTQQFNSIEEKNINLTTLEELRTKVNTLNQSLLTITRDIDNNAISYGIKNSVAKYSVIGFWSIQEPIFSKFTTAQHIIHYDIQYRYLSKNVDTLDTVTISIIENGQEVTAAFSQWIDLPSKTLTKIKDVNGEMVWESPIIGSADDININQLAIPITESESIEIRVRAVTEAGYPISPLKSEWSNIMRINFPDDIKYSSLSTLISNNDTDLLKAEFNGILQNLGILEHINSSFTENDKIYFHKASDISSGQYTDEKKSIPLDNIIQTIINDIKLLQNNETLNNIDVSLVDFNNNTYNLQNNTTIEISAGNLNDTYNILDNTSWGNIISKRCYIKIRNNNQTPIEIKSLVPGNDFSAINAPLYYNVPVRNEYNLIQDARQIIYFRNVDLTRQSTDQAFWLVRDKLPNSKTYPNISDINTTAPDTQKNILYRDIDGNVKVCKLNDVYTQDFVAFTTEHPIYAANNLADLNDEFNRIELYTNNLKAEIYQSETNPTDLFGLGFNPNDKYTLGPTSCGAFLYPVLNNLNILVNGNTSVSTLILQKESEILIPIIYEYRMIDRLGNINGDKDFDVNQGLIYNKKLGIDLLINNNRFSFDLSVTSKLKSNLQQLTSDDVNQIIYSINNENKEILT